MVASERFERRHASSSLHPRRSISSKLGHPRLRDASCAYDCFSSEAITMSALPGPTIPASVTPGMALESFPDWGARLPLCYPKDLLA